MKKLFLILLSTIILISCNSNKKEKTEIKFNKQFEKILKEYAEDKLKLNPLEATYAGKQEYNDKLPNFLSDEYVSRVKKNYKQYLSKINEFDNSKLTKNELISKKILIWDCEMNLKQYSFKKDILLPINQMWSLNLTMGTLASGSSAQPFNTVKDYRNWLKRLESYNIWLKTALKRMKQGIKEGYVLPKSLIKKIIPQFEVLAKVDNEKDIYNHLFFSPIKKMPSNFSEVEKEQLKTAYILILEEQLIPSFKDVYEFLKTDYLNAGLKESGISAIPQGKEYYSHAVKYYTTTTMTTKKIHELGLKEVERISSEMEKIKNEVEFKGSLKAFFNHLRTYKKLMPYKQPQEIIDNFNAIHNKMKPQLKQLFGNKPKTKFVVKQTEKFREASASAEYQQGSLDGTRPGVFYTPIPDATKYNVLSDEALFLHEAIPGHHYQISLTQENKNLPDFRKTLWYSAYGEGWALYTESLGKELGLYTDPYQYFGMLSMEMHRAIRLVVDTGIHAMGWTREQAIQYSLENEAESKSSITSEIERYMANPGQALSYKIGQLKIRELRSRAEKQLGDKFNIREFHNQILETGCIPLALLEDKIDAWITTKSI